MKSVTITRSFMMLAISALALCTPSTKAETVPKGKLEVLKKGNIVYIRENFSADKDLVQRMQLGRFNKQITFANTFLNSKTSPITAANELIHGNSDDACPWNLNRTYIGGNHGCSDGREVTSANHGLTTADIGSQWNDEAGTAFYVLKVLDGNRFWVLSEDKGKDGIWKFTKTYKGDLKNKKSGKTLKVEGWKMAQITPANRIIKQDYLVDGKTPLIEGKPVICSSFDIVEEYDVICPDAVVASAKNNPGKELNFIAEDLDFVTKNKIIYRFQPGTACEVHYQAEAGRNFKLGYMGFIQTGKLYQGKGYSTHEYYIPKTVAAEQKGRKIDFKNIVDFTSKWDTVNFYLNRGPQFVENPANLPERFIQFLGNKKDGKPVRQVGYAFGYSLIEGDTRPEIRAKNCANPLFLYRSKKSYPHAIDSKMGIIPKGKKFECTAYRQYFNPTAYSQNATAVYHHKQGDSTVLYVDYHKSVDKDTIKLPEALVGKKISIIEKTPSVTLLSGDNVPADGISLGVKDNYGYVVLKIN